MGGVSQAVQGKTLVVMLAAALIMGMTLAPVPLVAPEPVYAEGDSMPAPVIGDVQIRTPELARYERFEVSFDVTTVATAHGWPYDPAPPPGLPAGTGISVEALFSNDNWSTVITQPAFLEQPYTHSFLQGRDHFTPSGPPHWTVRCAPQQTGDWQMRLRAQDAGGVSIYPSTGSLTFTVSGESSDAYTRRGFVRVSPTDPRYFEFQDETPFVGVGYNNPLHTTSVNSEEVEERMTLYEQYKMNFMRVWLSAAGINGSHWTSWGSHHQSAQGYLPGVSLDTEMSYDGADVALRLDATNPCLFADFWQGRIPVEPETNYRVSARVRLDEVTGPADQGEYGFVIKVGGWLGTACDQAGLGDPITQAIGGTTDWISVAGDYAAGPDQHWMDWLYLTRENATGGSVYIDEVRIWRADDPDQVNILREANANSHLDFDPMNSAQWDLYLESAEQHGVYLKLVVDEKNEWIRNHIDGNGDMVASASNDNFYAAPDTKIRWLQEAWWRYIIGRWGYSTAIHSFEYINEGDPYNGHHYEAANAMAQYFDEHDPSQHMVTTSFWHSFPSREFWTNPQFQAIDYADLHAYNSTGWGRDASFLDTLRVETNAEHIRSGNASAHLTGEDRFSEAITPRGLVVQGEGEWIIRYWMKAAGLTSDCVEPGLSQLRVRWKLDGGTYGGGTEGVAPANQEGKDWVCTSPGATFDWTEMRSDQDMNGVALPATSRLVLTDDGPHEISLWIENWLGTGGNAWIDDLELISPSGEIVPVIGQFDITPLDGDTAWSNRAYGEMLGANSPVGVQMPLVRGETGMDAPDKQDWQRAVNSDTLGIWLHNNLWGQVNPGGMYDLFWWSEQTIDENPTTGRHTHIYTNYLTYRNFMEDIPLNNGYYKDVGAETSQPDLRAWGQRDDVNGRMHLWIQNRQHTWKRVVFGPEVEGISGVVTIPEVTMGTYRVTWWDTYDEAEPVFRTETVFAAGSLVLELPELLESDVAMKVERIAGAQNSVFLPLVSVETGG